MRLTKKILLDAAKRSNRSDANRVLRNRRTIGQKASKGLLKSLFADIMLMVQLLDDYVHGRYRRIPWLVLASIIVALVWLLTPTDLIFDYAPLGFTDDIAILKLVLALAEAELDDYGRWQKEQKQNDKKQAC